MEQYKRVESRCHSIKENVCRNKNDTIRFIANNNEDAQEVTIIDHSLPTAPTQTALTKNLCQR